MRIPLQSVLLALLLLGPALSLANQDTSAKMVLDGDKHPAGMPARGATMDEVKKAFGNPQQIIGPSGEPSKSRPPITRWVYKDYIVYFEKNRVIHSARPRSLNIIKFLDTPTPAPALQPAANPR